MSSSDRFQGYDIKGVQFAKIEEVKRDRLIFFEFEIPFEDISRWSLEKAMKLKSDDRVTGLINLSGKWEFF